nr:hypothetical protein GCM10020093_037100 [Planobispora longispora]
MAFYGIPYLEPELVRGPWELPERSHTAAVGHAMSLIRADAARRGTRSVVLAHAFVTGGQGSDSERDISVGGLAHVPVTVFDGADYVALGHLHGRQRMTETVRYSGSPIAYSFSEADQVKGSWLVELGPDGFAGAEFVEAPVPRRLGRLTGRLDDLLTSAEYAGHEDRWLQVTLTDPIRPKGAMERLRTRFEHTLTLSFEPEGGVRETVTRARTAAVPRSRWRSTSSGRCAARPPTPRRSCCSSGPWRPAVPRRRWRRCARTACGSPRSARSPGRRRSTSTPSPRPGCS